MNELHVVGVSSFDVDEAQNRIVIGVESETASAAVYQQLQAVGVPAAAVVTVVESAPILYTTLQDSTNRVGGLQISRGGTSDACTLTALAFARHLDGSVDSTNIYFFTNAHCSATPFSVDSGWMGQPTISLPIGYEVKDPALYSNSYSPLCPASDASFPGYAVRCRTSDAALYVGVYSMNPTWHGTIAATPGLNNINITDSRSIANTDYPYSGQVISKTGRTSGTTSGSVLQTCVNLRHSVDVAAGISRWMLCQARGSMYAGPGDSGSPVSRSVTGYSWLYTPVTLVGIVWGGANPAGGTNTYFSPWPNVEGEIGPYVVWR